MKKVQLPVSAQQTVGVFHVLIQGVLLYYIYNLEKNNCECSEQQNLRNIVKYMTTLVMVFGLVKLLLIEPGQQTLSLGLLNIVNMGVVVYYLFNMIRNKNCECSKSWQRILVFTVYTIIMGLYTLLLSVPFMLFALPLAMLMLPFIVILFVVKFASQ